MAVIKTMGPGPHIDFSVSGTVISIGEEVIYTEELQEDSERIVDVYQSADGQISLEGPGAFVANIRIPARRYETEVVDAEGLDENGDQRTEVLPIPQPLHPDSIEITVWPRV